MFVNVYLINISSYKPPPSWGKGMWLHHWCSFVPWNNISHLWWKTQTSLSWETLFKQHLPTNGSSHSEEKNKVWECHTLWLKLWHLSQWTVCAHVITNGGQVHHLVAGFFMCHVCSVHLVKSGKTVMKIVIDVWQNVFSLPAEGGENEGWSGGFSACWTGGLRHPVPRCVPVIRQTEGPQQPQPDCTTRTHVSGAHRLKCVIMAVISAWLWSLVWRGVLLYLFFFFSSLYILWYLIPWT